jgi:hypothetical protein
VVKFLFLIPFCNLSKKKFETLAINFLMDVKGLEELEAFILGLLC